MKNKQKEHLHPMMMMMIDEDDLNKMGVFKKSIFENFRIRFAKVHSRCHAAIRQGIISYIAMLLLFSS